MLRLKGKKKFVRKEANVKQVADLFSELCKAQNERTSTVQRCHGYPISYQTGESDREGKPRRAVTREACLHPPPTSAFHPVEVVYEGIKIEDDILLLQIIFKGSCFATQNKNPATLSKT